MKKQGAGDSAGARSLDEREPHHVVPPGGVRGEVWRLNRRQGGRTEELLQEDCLRGGHGRLLRVLFKGKSRILHSNLVVHGLGHLPSVCLPCW